MLVRAIRSVLNQTYTRLRVFVTDNASGDETASVVRAIQAQDPRVIYHCQPENLGMHANYTYGKTRVVTPFFSFLSDDDVLLPEFYETAYREFERYPQALLVATQVPCVTEEGRFLDEPLSMWDRMGLFEPPSGAHRVAAIAHPTIIGVLFRREFLQAPFAYPDPRIHGGDYDMLFNAALHYPIVTVSTDGALFVHHRGQRVSAEDPFSVADHYFDLIRTIDKDGRFPAEFRVAHRQRWLKYLSGYLNGQVIRLSLIGDMPSAKKALAILDRDLEQKQQAAKLELFYRFCCALPLLRPLLRNMHATTASWKNRLRQSRYVLGDAKYANHLK